MMKVLGIDGIERDLDEHYDQMSDVSEDPFGAHKAIQDLWAEKERLKARIDELEAKIKTITKKWAEASGLAYDFRAELKQARAALKGDE